MRRNTIVIIPARGGSKRLPRKNLVDFFGKPMIAWTIQAAVLSGVADKIVVSTDDEDIAEVSKKYGAEVPFFRDSYADDYSSVSQATVYTLNRIEKDCNEYYDNIIQLMANCPLRSSHTIRDFFDIFLNGKANFQISCFKYGWMNPWWAVTINDKGMPERIFPDAFGQRSQDMPKLFCPTGAVWVAKAKHLKLEKTFYGKGHRFYPIPWEESVDIDDEDDLNFAKAVYILKQTKENNLDH